MKDTKECPKCGSNRTSKAKFIVSDFQKASIQLGEKKWFGEFAQEDLYVNVCADCGNVDFSISVDTAQKMWKIHQKNMPK